MVTTRSLSGQHAEESNREETGSWSFAKGTNGLLTFTSIAVIVQLGRPGMPGPPTVSLALFPSLALDLSGIPSLRPDTLSSAPFWSLIMTKSYFT